MVVKNHALTVNIFITYEEISYSCEDRTHRTPRAKLRSDPRCARQKRKKAARSVRFKSGLNGVRIWFPVSHAPSCIVTTDPSRTDLNSLNICGIMWYMSTIYTLAEMILESFSGKHFLSIYIAHSFCYLVSNNCFGIIVCILPLMLMMVSKWTTLPWVNSP